MSSLVVERLRYIEAERTVEGYLVVGFLPKEWMLPDQWRRKGQSQMFLASSGGCHSQARRRQWVKERWPWLFAGEEHPRILQSEEDDKAN